MRKKALKKAVKKQSKSTNKNDKNDKEIYNIKKIVEFLNSTLSTNYSWKTKQTQKLIRGRLREGYTIEDFKLVIEDRKRRWQNDEKMRQYLRPSTLFRPSNFENYLQYAKSKKEEPIPAYLRNEF